MKFFSIVLSLCLHLIVILLLVHFTCVSQKHVSKEEKLYKVSLVSLQEKKARKKIKSIPKKPTKKKEIVAKIVPEKKNVKKKKTALLEKVGKEMYSKKIEEKREKEIEEKKTAMRRKVQEGEGKQKRVENEEKRQEKYGSYKELLKTSITKKWFLNPAFIEKQNLKAEVEIVIDNDGNINTKKVKSSSSNKHFDEMVIDAISRSNPLPAVPPDLRENHYLDIKLEFTLEDYEKLHD